MSDERLASDVERILAQRLAAVFSEHKRDMGGEIVREIERGRAEADARWMEATGLPAPRGIDDWLRLAAAVGVPAERILNGDFAPRDVKLIAEGLRLRNKAGTTPEPSPPVGKGKRSTARGDARAKIIAALTKHHRYAAGSLLNQEPVSVAGLAAAAGVSKSTASSFLADEFKGHAGYMRACGDNGKLIAALKMLRGEFSPSMLFGGRTPDEAENPEHRGDRRRKPRASELNSRNY